VLNEVPAMNELEQLEAMLRARPAGLSLEQRGRRTTRWAIASRWHPTCVEAVAAHGVPAEWTSTPAANPSEVILYLHGGGYAWGSLKSHRHLASEVGARRR
jgi:acetyl esterase/lipase